jgi:anti-sigma regulatory factor (Ser/Thr protein kinase)
MPAMTRARRGNPLVMGAVLLGRLSIGGTAKNVAQARAFVAETVGKDHSCTDTAVLLSSELVTNAVLHSDSRRAGGTVTVLVAALADSIRVEVTDEGSAGSIPVVKEQINTPDGHGLFLVENLADQWGFTRGRGRTTVWFDLIS